MTMGHRVAVLRARGPRSSRHPTAPLDHRPANVFVAGFIGSPAMNIAEFRIEDGHAVLGRAPHPADAPRPRPRWPPRARRPPSIAGFRPESIDLVSESEAGAFPVDVRVVEELGSDAFLHGDAAQKPAGRAPRSRPV